MEFKFLENILKTNLFKYQKEVNEDRANPFSEDGLKPVHRRILYAALEGGYTSSKEYKKSARIVGDTMGKYHPHGDTAIYEAMVRLAQPWKMRYPLIDIHGNMGNIDGDGAAAMRYTNARLTKLAEEGMLGNLKKRNVDFVPNYDEDEEEPVVLPSIFPNLLCNPNKGIGWAMAAEWLPHNLNEVSNAIYDYLEGKEPMLPGPDFPTGCQIINEKDMRRCYLTGKGTVRFRARYKTEKDNIVFYEVPYGQTTEAVIESINKYAKDNCPEIREVSNESSKTNIRLVVRCEKNTNLDAVAAKLYSKTKVQDTASFNQVAIVNGKPKLINLKEAIEVYVKHNISCIIKEAEFDLKKAQDRLHIVDGLLKALEDIDNIIALIKKSESAAVAKEALIKKYNFTEIQAKAILAMRLSSLASLEKIELQNEKATLCDDIADLNTLIISEDAQKAELKIRLSSIVKKFGDDRRTELNNIEITKAEKEIIEVIPEDVVVMTTQTGLIKKVPLSSFKVQKRNGKGIKSGDDIIISTIKTNTVDSMMFFTDKGIMYRAIVDNIPDGTTSSKGVHISSITKMDSKEKIMAVSSLHRKTAPKYVIFITKNGLIKKTLLEEYLKTNRNTGIQAITLNENDSLVQVLFQDTEDLLILTKKGMSIRIKTDDINAIGRAARGIKGIKLAEDDNVQVAMSIHKESDYVGIISENGIGKKIPVTEYLVQGKNGKGVITSDLDIAGAAMIDDNDNIFIYGSPNNLCISSKDLPVLNKRAQGVKVIKSGKVVTITKI